MRARAAFRRVNGLLDRVGEVITSLVGSMWCAIVFAYIALTGLPEAIHVGQFVPWLTQSFLQLVLLSIIMVGQRRESARTSTLIQETHDAVIAELRDVRALLAAAGIQETGGE